MQEMTVGFLSQNRTRPFWLAPTLLIIVLLLVLGGVSAEAVVPTFTIENVIVDTSVTIQTQNFPPNQDFVVRMGPNGTLAIDGEVVGVTNSGGTGIFSATYPIPLALRGADRIAIRLESPQGYYSYNWFYNNREPKPDQAGTGTPTFTIESVVINESVTIMTQNFPPGREFIVMMDHMGTLAINGYPVGVVNSAAGGSFMATFPIPQPLVGLERIAIRAESGPYFAYNWFDNQPLQEARTPTMRVCAVTRDVSVGIQTATSFPPNREFAVLMGPMGTNGIDGYVAGTLNSGPTGSVSAVFAIPSGLRGLDQIAIRLDEIEGPHYSFDYFDNRDGFYCAPAPVPSPTASPTPAP
jgi:hypothetical protein